MPGNSVPTESEEMGQEPWGPGEVQKIMCFLFTPWKQDGPYNRHLRVISLWRAKATQRKKQSIIQYNHESGEIVLLYIRVEKNSTFQPTTQKRNAVVMFGVAQLNSLKHMAGTTVWRSATP